MKKELKTSSIKDNKFALGVIVVGIIFIIFILYLGNVKTVGEAADIGTECRKDSECGDDFNACTDEKCVDGICASLFNSRGCNDNDGCTVNDNCVMGVCAGKPKECDDGDDCTADSCREGRCIHEGSPCPKPETKSYTLGDNGAVPAVADYDGDGADDIATFNPISRKWKIRFSSAEPSYLSGASLGDNAFEYSFGAVSDIIPVSADYDGDGKEDLALFNPMTLYWHIKFSSQEPPHLSGLRSPTRRVYKGDYYYLIGGLPATTAPIQGDFDGDGITDLATYQRADGKVAIMFSSGPPSYLSSRLRLGNIYYYAYAPLPIDVILAVADYSGDGLADLGVYYQSERKWIIRDSLKGYLEITQQNPAGSAWPVPADYDGDGAAERAAYLPNFQTNGDETYDWTIEDMGNYDWGSSGKIPVPGDYDGDGRTDIAVFQASKNKWSIYYFECTRNDNCVDDNICTNDICNKKKNCINIPTSNGCNDDDGCTIRDMCIDGVCQGIPLYCDDGRTYTTDYCLGGKCYYSELVCSTNAECDDADGCTRDECIDGSCRSTVDPSIPGCTIVETCSDIASEYERNICYIDLGLNGDCSGCPDITDATLMRACSSLTTC